MSREIINNQEQPRSPEFYRDSPKSANIRAYYKGFSIQLTLRDENEQIFPLLDKMIEIADYMEEKDFKPSWKVQANKKTEDKKAPEAEWINDKEKETKKEIRPDHCSIHNKDMKSREGQYGTFYSHARKDEETGKWEYCNGKGYPSEK